MVLVGAGGWVLGRVGKTKDFRREGKKNKTLPSRLMFLRGKKYTELFWTTGEKEYWRHSEHPLREQMDGDILRQVKKLCTD